MLGEAIISPLIGFAGKHGDLKMGIKAIYSEYYPFNLWGKVSKMPRTWLPSKRKRRFLPDIRLIQFSVGVDFLSFLLNDISLPSESKLLPNRKLFNAVRV